MDRNRALEKTKASVFMGTNAAFLGTLLCHLSFRWSKETSTAGVSKKQFIWNPDWFDTLTADERKGVFLHELWHIALLHGLRKGTRDHKKWNVACDLRINADLLKEGYVLPQGGLFDEKYADSKEWSEEKIYDDLPETVQTQVWGSDSFSEDADQVALVQSAMVSAKGAGGTPGNVAAILDQFLRPVLPWKQLLHNYLTDKFEEDWSWAKPNRRFRDIYMPSLLPEDGSLDSIAMFLDTSGSISDREIQRFVSEIKFVQENLMPNKLILVQFDRKIQKVDVYNKDHLFKSIEIVGMGGTSYKEVHDFIEQHKPTISLIFTDLYAVPMEPVKSDVVWVVSGSGKPAPSFGKTFYVE